MAFLLLVGVDNLERRKVRSILERAGHTVIAATTAHFLKVPGEQPVDAAIIEISPFLHNVHLIGVMELRRRYPDLPIIALCGGPDAAALVTIALQAGVSQALAKPIAPDEILEAVAQCLAGPKRP